MLACPFKAPVESSLPFGNREVATLRFDQREGLSFSAYRFSTDGSESFAEWPFQSFSQIVFVLSGRIDFSFPIIGERSAQAGDWFALSPSDLQNKGAFAGRMELAVIECSNEIWQGLASEEDLELHTRRACLGCSQRPEAIFLKDQMDPAINALVRELSEANGASSIERLLIEAKTLELLSLIAKTPPLEQGPRKDPCLREYDHDSVAAAAAYLEANLSEDHSLAAISRQVSLNEFKLKKGFRERFGKTVFGYLRQKRMERAREILRTRSTTILEVANIVGSTNPSHFSRASRESFGINPKAFISRNTQ